MLGALVVTFAISYVVTVRVLFPPLPEPEAGIVVPSLRGLSVAEAENQLRQLQLRLAEVSDIAHPSQPAGTIVAQSPLAGQQLRELGSVRVAISAGLPRMPVPNVIGFTAERATNVLAAVGFAVDRQIVENEAAAGTVVRILPAAGNEVQVPGRVVVFVSSGPPPELPADSVADAEPVDSIPAAQIPL
jgi:serine/threonine-protein kinase